MSITLTAQSGETLTSITRLTQNAQLSALNTSNPTLLSSLLASSTAIIQRATHRKLISADYTHYVSGNNYPYDELQMPEYPVTSITRVATNPQTVLRVVNGSDTLNQRATIQTTTGGVIVYRMASGVATSVTKLYSDFPTITLLANAITAIGSGFTASVQSPFGNHPSVDIRPMQGAYTCFAGGAELQLFTEELTSALALSSDDSFTFGGTYGWRLDDDSGILHGYFPRGTMNVRIDYTAGFVVMPDDLQEACTQLVLDLYNSGLANQTMKSGRLGPYSFERDMTAGDMSEKVRAIVSRYTDHAKVNQVR